MKILGINFFQNDRKLYSFWATGFLKIYLIGILNLKNLFPSLAVEKFVIIFAATSAIVLNNLR